MTVGRRAWTLTALTAAACAATPSAGSAAIAYTTAAGPEGRAFVAADDGSGARALGVRAATLVISPDGARVAFQAWPGDDGRMRFLTVATGAVVVSPRRCRSAAVWSPDGSRVLCQTETANARGFVTGNGLAVVDAATGASRVLVRAPGNAVDTFTWSPDGARIAFSRGRFGATRTDVFVADPADMASARRLVPDATAPVWGPVKLAFVRLTTRRSAGAGEEIRSQIWTVNPSGGGARALTRFRTRLQLVTGPFPAFWTPDGARLLGSVGGTDYAQLIAVDARSGAIRPLGRFGFSSPDAVSTDGRTVLFTEGIPDGGPIRVRTIGVGGAAGRVVLTGVRTVSATRDWAP